MLLEDTVVTMTPIRNNKKSYEELITIKDYYDRYEYLRLPGKVGEETFGALRHLNQSLYTSKEWRDFRNWIISRDLGHDMAMEDTDFEIPGIIVVHHINPLTIEDIEYRSDSIFDPNNAVCVAELTHKAIHYGDISLIKRDPIERFPGDTCPWFFAKKNKDWRL